MDHVQYAFLANAVDSSGTRLREYKILIVLRKPLVSRNRVLLEIVRCLFLNFLFSPKTFILTTQTKQLCNDNNKRFINKAPTKLRLNDIYVGGAVTINSRQFFIQGYADRATSSAQLDQATYSLHGQTGGNETIRRCGVIGREEWIDCC